ncbi:MAG TPA: YhjD/YihY/BrkB family envelope integrity protein, partial [Burkholderiaceae bacterium]|nr:YhjD/YihY/BrkB family envelope integrity protein [Burkholderiaceae bacterium]
MRKFATNAKKALRHPIDFSLAVLKQFRANQGLLLAGAVAYYALLSLVPLLILVVLALTQIFNEQQVLGAIGTYLEFVVPGQSYALVGELRNFLMHRELVGWLLLALMLFFSTLAFTVLENAMSVIFFHRVTVRRRHFLASAVMPYLFIVALAVGLMIITVVSGALSRLGTHAVVILGESRPLDEFSAKLLYLLGVGGEILLLTAIYMVMPVGRLSLRHALIGGTAAAILW